MSWVTRRNSAKTALSPGTMIHVGEKKTEAVSLGIIYFEPDYFEEKELGSVDEVFPYKDKPGLPWINISGLHEVDIITKIGKHFGLHDLILEDIVNTEQRPKIDDMDDYLFIVAKMLSYHEETDRIESEQVSLVLGENFLLSFQERTGDVFDPVRERIRKKAGRLRRGGSDYLAYALIDAVVDNYFAIIDRIGEKLAVLDERLMADPDAEDLRLIHHFKRELSFLRKSIQPLREVLSTLEKGESSLVQEKTRFFFRDVYDHVIEMIETIETYRDIVMGMLDVYLSSLSNRMNEVMKVLTIIATIFIPLTFIAGIYGMNFKYMPELELRWGYPVILVLMLFVVCGMLLWFKRRRLL